MWTVGLTISTGKVPGENTRHRQEFSSIFLVEINVSITLQRHKSYFLFHKVTKLFLSVLMTLSKLKIMLAKSWYTEAHPIRVYMGCLLFYKYMYVYICL